MTPEPAVEVEGLTKRYRGRDGRSWVPVPSFFRGRGRPGIGERPDLPIPDVDIDDDADPVMDEPDEDEEEVDEERPGHPVVALSEVSLKVAPGTTLGIVGPNGAGKSTLLRVLTRLTPPTEGTAVLRGRVAPLVPGLSGVMLPRDSLRSNVVHVAQFLGIPKSVATARIDAVAEFAELQNHLHQRVSSLSPGQLNRFAFAIVLQLEPDILIADDMIAVGDRSFQQYCLEHIRRRADRGLTVLFASHRLDLVRSLCREAILMDAGRIVERGPVRAVVDRYEATSFTRHAPRGGNGDGGGSPLGGGGPLLSAGLFSTAGRPATALHASEGGLIEILLDVAQAPATIRCILGLHSPEIMARATQPTPFTASEPGRYVVSAYVPAGALGNGVYRADVAATGFTAEGRRPLGRLRDAFELEVYGIVDEADDSIDEADDSIAEADDSAVLSMAAAPSKRRLDLTWSVSRIDDQG
jgi:lipopolysaccharide transport system ATP-binding protein